MGKLIKVSSEPHPPVIICPHCAEHNLLDLKAWEGDVTRIMQDKCRSCGGEIVVALLILADRDIKKVLQTVQAIAATVNQKQLFQGK